jgi:2',3'-cyclic-nucleotide 2'-phosphodiesterase
VTGTMRLLFVGDVVGAAGRDAAKALIPTLRRELSLDVVVVSADDSADTGFGATAASASALLSVADLLTLGDHTFAQAGSEDLLAGDARITRTAYGSQDRPGRPWRTIEVAGTRLGVVRVQGRVFMQPQSESPFAAVERAQTALAHEGAQAIVVEIHGEATSEKQAMRLYCVGRAALVIGTGKRVATADARLFSGGTAYQTDAGMTGARDSIVGYDRDDMLRQITAGDRPTMRLRTASETLWLNGVLVETDTQSGHAVRVERLMRSLAV